MMFQLQDYLFITSLDNIYSLPPHLLGSVIAVNVMKFITMSITTMFKTESIITTYFTSSDMGDDPLLPKHHPWLIW